MSLNSIVIPHIKQLITPDIKSVLDLGCGNHDASFLDSNLRAKEDILINLFPSGYDLTGIDLFEGAIEYRNNFGPHGTYILGDIRNFIKLTNGRHFDMILCHHVIEHLPKEDGAKLIADVESKALKLVVFGAPQGFIKSGSDINKYQEHLSGWTAEDFPMYEVNYKEDVFLVSKRIG